MKDRELTPHTKWIVCVWDIRGESILETAMLLKRSLSQVKEIIAECKADGYYDMVRRYIEDFDLVNARQALMGFAMALCDENQEALEYEQRGDN